jgi:general stress protein 26
VYIEIKKGESLKEIQKRLRLSVEASEERKKHLEKLFGCIKLKEDAVTRQRRWRDE